MIFEAMRTHSGGLIQFLLNSSLQITVLILLVGGLSLFIRRPNSNFRYWLWSIVVLRLCIPVHFSLPFGLGGYVRALAQKVPEFATTPGSLENSAPGPLSTVAASPLFHIQPSQLHMVLHFWLGMVFLGICFQIFRFFYFRNVLKKSSLINRPEILQMLEDLRQEMKVATPVQLYYLNFDNSSGPLILGVLHPKIFLPRTIGETWTVDEVKPILAHEMVHVLRRDVLLNWVQIFVQTLYFFHPLVWLANWRTRHFREESCDDIAIRRLGLDKMKYTKCIYNSLAETSQNPMWKLANIGFAERKSSIAKRIVRILDKKYEARVTFNLRSVLVLLAIGAVSFMISCESIIGVSDKEAAAENTISASSMAAYKEVSKKFDTLIYITDTNRFIISNQEVNEINLEREITNLIDSSEKKYVTLFAEPNATKKKFSIIISYAMKAGALRVETNSPKL
ncbi:MAG: M56 family metallopeptidase [Candidatus Latescibacterota bacterium]